MTSRRLEFTIRSFAVQIAPLDPFCQLDLLIARQQRVATDLLKEQRHCIGRAVGECVVDVAGLLDLRAAAVIANVDTAILEQVLERLYVLVAELVLLGHLAQLRQLDAGVRTQLTAGHKLLGQVQNRLVRRLCADFARHG